MAKRKASRAIPRGGPTPTPATPRHKAASEETYHGLRACEALFARRPDEIVRVYLAATRKPRLAKLLGWCAEHRRGFQIVEEENLRRISGSTHHEGVAILAKAIRRWSLDDLLREVESTRVTGPILYLDGVENPHNLGSILRTAAHFGVVAIAGRSGELPPLSAAGFSIVAASSHRGEPPQAAPLGGRCVLVLGSEGKGVSPAIDRVATEHVKIPGTGAVESLNVSVAAGVLLAEAWRRR
jgi:TrmH RNA methyltransferase